MITTRTNYTKLLVIFICKMHIFTIKKFKIQIMKHISAILIYVMAILFTSAKAQTTHIITMPSSGNNTIDVNCAVGDIITLQSSVTPFAIQVFRNPTPNFIFVLDCKTTSYYHIMNRDIHLLLKLKFYSQIITTQNFFCC